MSASLDQKSPTKSPKTTQSEAVPNCAAGGSSSDALRESEFDSFLRGQPTMFTNYRQPPHGQAQQTQHQGMYNNVASPDTYGAPGPVHPFQQPYYPDTTWSNGGDATYNSFGGYPFGAAAAEYMGFSLPPMNYVPQYYNNWPGDWSTHWAPLAPQQPQPQSQVDRKLDEAGVKAGAGDYGYSAYRSEQAGLPLDYAKQETNGHLDKDMQGIETSLQSVTVSETQSMDGNGHSQGVLTTSAGEKDGASIGNAVGNSCPSTVTAAPSSTPVGPKKPISWASVASQPAKPAPVAKPKAAPVPKPSPQPNKAGGDNQGAWPKEVASPAKPANQPPRQTWVTNGNASKSTKVQTNARLTAATTNGLNTEASPILDQLRSENEYNPATFDMSGKGIRFFIIKSYSEDDIHRSIKYSIWCSTMTGNERLDYAFKEREGAGGAVYLFFSVNGSKHFCGMAKMLSAVDYDCHSTVWAQSKWKGQFKVKWLYVKDVPNTKLRHIRLENNENKPVTNSRDTQEVPHDKGKQVLEILHNYQHDTSIFDDFEHYEKKQQEGAVKKAVNVRGAAKAY